jgi:hypothetical protein
MRWFAAVFDAFGLMARVTQQLGSQRLLDQLIPSSRQVGADGEPLG